MIWPVPPRIEVPALSDLPYIRAKYERLLSIEHEKPDDDDDFAHNFFYNPASVAYEQVTALQMLSDDTFSALCRAMEPAFYDKPFRDKASLEAITLAQFETMNEFEEDNGHAIFEQVMSYILFKSRVSDDVRWDKIAELYNNSQESQQRALAFYFDKCENRDLLDVLSMRAPAFSLPETLNETFESKTEGGETLIFDPELERWMREDRFTNQFEVHGWMKTGEIRLVGTGPTLKIALGKAISFVRDDQDYRFNNVAIERHRCQIAQASVVLGDGHEPSQQLYWQPQTSSKKEAFTKSVFEVEKSLGVQWSKVRRLEDELGL